MYLDGYREKIVAWVQEGLSDRAIAERVRVSPSTVRYWRERNGIIRPPRGTGPGHRRWEAIEGHKEVDLHREEPAPPGFSVQVVWFAPTREGGPRHRVPTVAALRRVLAPYKEHERLVIYLDRDGGESGSVWVHLTGDRAWVTHFTQLGGVDSYCRDPGGSPPDQTIGFLLSNGQEDDIHRSWTVTRAHGFRALEYFLRHRGRDPGLSWVEQPSSLQEPA
jgi:hypothetical protein